MSNCLMTIENLNVAYANDQNKVLVLKDIHLSLKSGESLGVVGESGSGKTTLLRSIQGLLAPNASVVSGAIWYEGKELLKATPSERRKLRGMEMGMIFQEAMSSLNPVRTVGSQMIETLRKRLTITRKEAEERSKILLQSVELQESDKIMKAYPFQLSGGMRQRVLMALALCLDPRLLIADEPTASLDVMVQKKVLKLMAQLVRENKMSLLMATHDLSIVEQLSDQVLVMYAGSIVESGRTCDVLKNGAHPYTKALTDSVPKFDDPSQRLNVIPGSPPRLQDLPRGCAFHPRCTLKKAICAQKKPDIRKIASGREVACHFPS